MKSALERLRELRGLAPPEQLDRNPEPSAGPFRAEPLSPATLPPDWRIEWEERAAIREYDGGQAREHAEAEALHEIIERMRQVSDTRCAGGVQATTWKRSERQG